MNDVRQQAQSLLGEISRDSATDPPDEPRMRRTFLLVGAGYSILRAAELGYSAEDWDARWDGDSFRREMAAVVDAMPRLSQGRDGGDDSVRRWLAGFYVGSAAARLPGVAEVEWISDGMSADMQRSATEIRLWFDWFKHANQEEPKHKPPTLAEMTALLGELVRVRRDREDRSVEIIAASRLANKVRKAEARRRR